MKMKHYISICVLIMLCCIGCARSDGPEVVETGGGENYITFSRDLINDVPYKGIKGCFNMVVEIPSGTVDKWEVLKKNGRKMKQKIKKGRPREVKFIPYPGNYGFIPQTLLSKDKGGDGDPIDIIFLAPGRKRGTIQEVKVIGALRYLDRGEIDDKILAVAMDGPFRKIDDITEMFIKFPGAVDIVHTWFNSYKKPGKMLFVGYATAVETTKMIRDAHDQWKRK